VRAVNEGRPDACARAWMGLGVIVRFRPTGAGGRVSTPRTSCAESWRASNAGIATAGVPANITRMPSSLRAAHPEADQVLRELLDAPEVDRVDPDLAGSRDIRGGVIDEHRILRTHGERVEQGREERRVRLGVA